MTATSIQIDALLEFLSEHQELARGLIHSVEGRARTKRLWEKLATQLNSLGGAVKTVQQWKKVWADRKYLAKRANAAARRSATGTGGGPPTAEQLSQNDQKVIFIMGEGFGEPDVPACRLPAFPEMLLQPGSEPTPAEEAVEPPLLAPPLIQAHTGSSNNNLPASGRPRLRRRIRPQMQPDLHSRVLRLEEEKKEVLAGILEELKTLNRTIKTIMDNNS